MGTAKENFWLVVFIVGLIAAVTGMVFLLEWLGHSLEMKELRSYDYASIDGVIYHTEDIEDIKWFENDKGKTFYIKDAVKPIHTTRYTYFNENELDKYLELREKSEIKEGEFLND